MKSPFRKAIQDLEEFATFSGFQEGFKEDFSNVVYMEC